MTDRKREMVGGLVLGVWDSCKMYRVLSSEEDWTWRSIHFSLSTIIQLGLMGFNQSVIACVRTQYGVRKYLNLIMDLTNLIQLIQLKSS